MTDVRIGPAGGLGGAAFDNYTLPEGARLKEIHVMSDMYVHALQLVYISASGERGHLGPIGSVNGNHSVFTLDDDEMLTGLSGLCDWYVDQIRFHTNKRVSESYGGDGTSNTFSFEVPAGYGVVGLFGQADWYLDAIGIIGQPLPKPKAKKKAPAARANAAAVEAPKREPRPKDLEKVEGIGPKIAQLLIDAGIYDLVDLSVAEVARLKEILAAAGKRYALADPSTWPDQAALGAKGDWAAMEAMQKTLTAGRKG
ncbi:MAG: hypothetical protein MUD01_17385 [Chloroflexaceae bacterium]|jgi:predicted flap endonuclease-1-like 5' DNA nuclease|nr:hypothetical protein [Chloroflexaceae bacterium]